MSDIETEASERQKLLHQISLLRKAIDEAKAKGFRTSTFLADESEINKSDIQTIKLHLDNFRRVKLYADDFLKGLKSKRRKINLEEKEDAMQKEKKFPERTESTIGDKTGVIVEALKGSFDELGKNIKNLSKKIDDNTKQTLELVKEVKTLKQTSQELTTTEKQIASGGVQATSPQDFAKAFAEQLQRLGIGGTHSPTETDKHGNGNRQDNAWKIVMFILGALLFGGIYGWQALESSHLGEINRTLADHAQKINTINTLEKKADEHERQIASINTKIAELVSEIERLSKHVEFNRNDLVKLNNELGDVRKLLRDFADNFALSLDDLEKRFGQQIEALDKTLRNTFEFEVYDFLTFHDLAICIFGIGCFGQRSSKPEQPVYSPPTPPTEQACTSGLVYTKEGTYLVGVTKISESPPNPILAGTIRLQLAKPVDCFDDIFLRQFDSVQGQKINQDSLCLKENGYTITCPKVANYRLRNIRTTIGSVVEVWGNVAGGSIP